MRFKSLAAAVLLAGLACPCAAQQAWPAKPVRIITPTATGGTLDILVRLFADHIARATGQSWLLDNRAGGQGVIGTNAAAKSAPDGYTFFVGGTENYILAPRLIKDIPYDPQRELAPVSVLIDTTAFAIAVHSELPAKNLRELISIAKARPKSLSYAVTGSTADMIGNWLKKQAAIDVEGIFYKAATQSVQDVASGRVAFTINALPPLEPLIKAGKLRVLALTSSARVPGWESIETVDESVPGFLISGLIALAAPSGTPAEIQQRVNREANAILRNSDFVPKASAYGWFNRQGARTIPETAEFVRAERERWHAIIDGLGMKPG